MPKGKRPIKSIAETEGVDIKSKGLRLAWITFIDAYIENGGNATQAYMKAYPNCTKETARRNGSNLLTKADVIAELDNTLKTQKITENWIISSAIEYVDRGRVDEKYAMAGAKTLEMLAKTKGMLVDTKKIAFTGENPALFPSLVKPEEAKQFAEDVKKGERISE